MTQQPISYPSSAPQPLFWQGLVAVMVNVMILMAFGAWTFSQLKKAAKGEEVERPF